MIVKQNFLLIAGGLMSALISLLHVILSLKPALFYRLINLNKESASGPISGNGLSIAALILALFFAIWAFYAFSGAGLIKPLPLLRRVLIAIGIVYILRSFFLPFEVSMVLTKGHPFQFVVYSAISLVTGLLYLVGTLWKR
jgi:hypothetical protein